MQRVRSKGAGISPWSVEKNPQTNKPLRGYRGFFVWLLVLLAAAACSPTLRPGLGSTPEAEDTAGERVSPMPTFAALPTPTAELRSRDVHQAEGAGRWYPADPAKLQATVEAYVSQAQVEPLSGRLLAVIVPHAGYLYSGAVAGYAFRALQEAGCAGHTLAVVGDTHTGNGSAEIAVWAAGAFETPLGRILVDEAVAQAIVAADPRIQFDRPAFGSEHPVENQLPFIQAACPDARIVPVVIREPSLRNAQTLADALVAAFGEHPATIVASTDLSHYHPYDEARRIDEVALQAVVSLDPQAVVDSPRRCTELGIASQPSTMCSQGAVLTALIAARQMGANRATVLHYANSGDVPIGERGGVVGYGAVALWQDGSGENLPTGFALPPTVVERTEPTSLSPKAREELLSLARRTAAQFLTIETFPTFRTDDPALLQPLGAYVTYEKDGLLRGCLGRLVGDRPVYLNVQYAAAAAAVADPRFPPVTPKELDELTVEITLLDPMREVESPDEIQIGRDGVLMRVGEKDGALFLPQVPTDQGWDLPATLLNLCQKAGLPDDCWQRSDARFYVFGGQWFGEGE
jgi:AmmeMemoRadiSam system protein B/AmmeMemoRadiSam system protein A